MRLRPILVAVFVCVLCVSAYGHGSSNSYLTLVQDRAGVQTQWEIALRDLDYAIGLDQRGDGIITWGDLRRSKSAIEAYAMPRLAIASQRGPCRPGPAALLADQRGDGAYAVLRFAEACPGPVSRLDVTYRFMFDLDPTHRGLLQFIAGGTTQAVALSPDSPRAAFKMGQGLGATFTTFFRTGVRHIFSGADHMLFVAVLLLPAMFRRGARQGWTPVPRFMPAFLETVRILSAFTLAHALTVTVGALELIHLPMRAVEGAIMLTIALTAVDNIVPIFRGPRSAVAFGFGLVHGLGFASALGPLALPPLPLATALLAFNTGIEAAQVLIAFLVLPAGFLLRGVPFYARRLLPAASAAAALTALAWFAQGNLGLALPAL